MVSFPCGLSFYPFLELLREVFSFLIDYLYVSSRNRVRHFETYPSLNRYRFTIDTTTDYTLHHRLLGPFSSLFFSRLSPFSTIFFFLCNLCHLGGPPRCDVILRTFRGKFLSRSIKESAVTSTKTSVITL